MDQVSMHYQSRKYRLLQKYTVLAVLLLLLTPAIPLAPGIPRLRLDDILLIFAPFFVVMVTGRVIIDARLLILLIIWLLMEISITVGAFMGYPASIADHFYIFRILKYIGAVTLGAALVFMGKKKEFSYTFSWLAKITVLAGLGLIAVVFQQFVDLFGLNIYYVEFVAPTQYETLIGDYPWPRPVGMIGNPNELSFLLGIICLLGFWLYLTEHKRKLFWLLCSLLYLSTCFLTLSRSGVFATAIAIVIFLGCNVLTAMSKHKGFLYLKKNIMGRIFLVLGLGVTGMATVLFIDPIFEKMTWRFTPEYFGGWYKRIENWNENLGYWQDSPILGIGPLRHSNIFQHAADNEWLLLMRTGGVLLAAGVLLLLFVGVFSKKTSKRHKYLSFSLGVGASAYMIPAAFFYSIVIMPMALLLWTIAAPVPGGIIRVVNNFKRIDHNHLFSKTSDSGRDNL